MQETLSQVAARLTLPLLAQIAPGNASFGQVEYMVEANAFTRDALRSAWGHRVSWMAESGGDCTVRLGQLIGHHITAEVKFVRLNGRLVMFYSPTSRLVDYNMVDTFVADVRKLAATARPQSTPVGKCDANDFHSCVHSCRTGE